MSNATHPLQAPGAGTVSGWAVRAPTALLVVANGQILEGFGVGATGAAVGEVCFNTAMTGYEEILTDPSYAGQIITFTFPHIGNTGVNFDDIEANSIAARGLVVKQDVTEPSNWRAISRLQDWLIIKNIAGISGVDTRALTIKIRDSGAPNAVLSYPRDGKFDLEALTAKARGWNGLEGLDLAIEVTCNSPYDWNEPAWRIERPATKHHVVAVDYGAKRNILRCLVNAGCRVTVVPATASGTEILALQPDGVFLSNGPGDPAATAAYAVPAIQQVLDAKIPLFGICLGHQLLAITLGARTYKMARGHRGANQPVRDLQTGRVEITSQNHGFAVDEASLPPGVEITHKSLFDGSNEGIACVAKKAFSVQYHPEASPGPTDSHYLFARFTDMIEKVA